MYAANLDQIVPVFAVAQPAPSWNMLDRYLILAESNAIPAVICLTKVDLDFDQSEIDRHIEIYRACGYQVIQTSVNHPDGLPALMETLKGKTSLLLGKSGAGKTTLVNQLCPEIHAATCSVSTGGHQRGRHTTSTTEAHPLPGGGFIIDTPGSRELGLWNVDPFELAGCFREMAPYIGSCRFGLDCLHDQEPGCSIRRAVMEEKIHPLRYQSYLRMLEST